MRKAHIAVLCSSFNVKIEFKTNKTLPFATSTVVSEAPARSTVASFFLHLLLGLFTAANSSCFLLLYN